MTTTVVTHETEAELAALRHALALLGFDPNKVAELMQREGDVMWRHGAFELASVSFDQAKATDRGLGEKGISSMRATLESVRLTS